MHGLLSEALRWVSEDEGRALLQVARWAQDIPGGGGQVRLGGQLLEEEIPAGPGTCSLLGKGERRSGQVRTSSNPTLASLLSEPASILILSVNSKATEVTSWVRGLQGG